MSDPLVASVMRAAMGASADPCPDAELLALFADQQLARAELATVSAHLPGCERCQAIVAAYVRASADAPAEVSVLAGGHAPGLVARWLSGWRWVVPMASVAAVALVAVWVGRGPADQVAEQDKIAAVSDTANAPAEPGGLPSSAAKGTTAWRDAAPPAAEREARLEQSRSTEPAEQVAPQSASVAATDRGRAVPSQSEPLGRANSPRPDVLRDAGAGDGARIAVAPAAPPPAATARVADEPEQKAEAAGGGAIRESVDTRATAKAVAPTSADAARERRQAPPAAAATGAATATTAAAEVGANPAPQPARAAPPGSLAAAAAIGDARAASPADGAVANAFGTVNPRATAQLSGTVTYKARVALPAGAVIDVELNDVSRADGPAQTLARSRIVTRGEQVPIPFTLRYAPDAIQPRGRYLVQVRVTVNGRLTWITATAHPVFANGAATSTVAVVVDPTR